MNALDSGYSKLVIENRHYVPALFECHMFTCCQNIAQRGHDESEHLLNKGMHIAV